MSRIGKHHEVKQVKNEPSIHPNDNGMMISNLPVYPVGLDLGDFIEEVPKISEVQLFTKLENMGYEIVDIGDKTNELSKGGESIKFRCDPDIVKQWQGVINWVNQTEKILEDKRCERLAEDLRKKKKVLEYCQELGLDYFIRWEKR